MMSIMVAMLLMRGVCVYARHARVNAISYSRLLSFNRGGSRPGTGVEESNGRHSSNGDVFRIISTSSPATGLDESPESIARRYGR